MNLLPYVYFTFNHTQTPTCLLTKCVKYIQIHSDINIYFDALWWGLSYKMIYHEVVKLQRGCSGEGISRSLGMIEMQTKHMATDSLITLHKYDEYVLWENEILQKMWPRCTRDKYD